MTWSLKTIANRLCTFNSKVVACDEGWWLRRIEDAYEWETMRGNSHHDSIISPTLRDDRLHKVIFETKGWTMTGWIVDDMNVTQVMETFGIVDYKIISAMRTKDSLRVRLEKPVAIPISVMKWNQHDGNYVVVFACGFWVMIPRENLMNGGEVLSRIAGDLQINTEGKQLRNMVGKVIQDDEIVPSIVVLTSKGEPGYDLCDIKGSCFRSESGNISIALTNREANSFVMTMKASSVASICQAFGWTMICCENPDPFRPKQVVFRRVLGEIMITTKEFERLLHLWILRCLFDKTPSVCMNGNEVFVALKILRIKSVDRLHE